MGRCRLDQLLVSRGLAPSREKAQGLILSGSVLINDVPQTKAGQAVDEAAEIRIRGEATKYVGRGGDKLEPALRHFNVQVKDKTAIDIGASTGGFTDCMLQSGANKVYAIDVGTNQLDYKLRIDSRVVSMEQTHVKDLRRDLFDPPPTIAVVDLSFISVAKVLEYICGVLSPGSELIILVKPQFELEPEFVEKGGVVRNSEHQLEAVRRVVEAGERLKLQHVGTVPSELRGGKSGNQEYFVRFLLQPAGNS